MSVLRIAAEVAVDHLGLAPRTTLLDAGATAAAIDGAVRRGRLEIAERAVYRMPGSPRTVEQRLLACAFAAHALARWSDVTAAWLWGLTAAPRQHELMVPRGVRFRRPGLIVHESTDLHLDVPGRVRGVPVTSVGRTLLDCARHGDVDLELLIDEARRVHRISPSLLPWTVARHARRGRGGLTRLREAIVDDVLPASDFERLVCRWLTESGVGGWELHHRIVASGQPVEIDIAWPDLLVALELDGSDHWARRRVYEQDAPRRNRLEIAGWLVIRCTWHRWLTEPDEVLAEIRAALAVRAAELAAS